MENLYYRNINTEREFLEKEKCNGTIFKLVREFEELPIFRKDIALFTTDEIFKIVKTWSNRYSRNSVNMHISLIKKYKNFMKAKGYEVTEDDLDDTKLISNYLDGLVYAIANPISEETLIRLWQMNGKTNPIEILVMVLTFYCTPTIEELRLMTIEDIGVFTRKWRKRGTNIINSKKQEVQKVVALDNYIDKDLISNYGLDIMTLIDDAIEMVIYPSKETSQCEVVNAKFNNGYIVRKMTRATSRIRKPLPEMYLSLMITEFTKGLTSEFDDSVGYLDLCYSNILYKLFRQGLTLKDIENDIGLSNIKLNRTTPFIKELVQTYGVGFYPEYLENTKKNNPILF